MFTNCSTCNDHRNRQTREPFIRHEVLDAACIKVAADLFTIFGKQYPLVVDYYSKNFEVACVDKPADSPAVITALRRIFSRHDIPKIVFSDGGPQFTSYEFSRFTTEWDFSHDNSSPHFPQSNGLVERTIQTVKRAIKKAHSSGKDIYLALLSLRTTPSDDTFSPAQKIFDRQPRTTLPSIIKDAIPTLKTSITRPIHTGGKELSQLNAETTVRIRHDKQKDWPDKGQVIEK